LSDQYFSSYVFNVKVINTPQGYVCGTTNPSTIAVKIRSKGWQLLNLNINPSSEFLVSAGGDSGKINVDAYNQISENSWLGSGVSIIDITPRTISLNVEKVAYKKLKVEPDTDLTFQDGFGLATPIKVFPDSILAAGPKSVINKTTSIKTRLVTKKLLDRKAVVITDLQSLPGFEFQSTKVELAFDVQRIVDDLFDGIKVTVNNIPPDRDVVLIPNIISCSLRGGINIIGKITPDQIKASINYSDVVLDTVGALKPNIIIPANTKLLFVKPEELRYIIKKF
jgi:hypothetical protein